MKGKDTVRIAIVAAVLSTCGIACVNQSARESGPAPALAQPAPRAPVREPVELLKPTGPFAVGTVRLTLTDAGRQDPFANGRDRPRLITVQVWYPVNAGAITSASKRSGYLLPEQSAFMISADKDASYRFPKALGEHWADLVKVHSFIGLPVSAAGGRLPLLLYSPGLHSLSGLGQHYLEEMASHGFAVAGVDSPGVCGAAVLPGGEVAVNSPVPAGMSFADSLGPKFEAVLADVAFTLDALEKSDGLAAGGLLHRRLDFSRVGMFGISFGGRAANVLAQQEPRIKAAASLEGGLNTTPPAFKKPFMVLAGGAAGDSVFRALSAVNAGPTYLVFIPEAGHENFGDVPFLSAHFYPGKEWRYPNVGAIDHVRCTALVRNALVSFFRAYLQGGDPSGIAASLKDFKEARLTVE